MVKDIRPVKQNLVLHTNAGKKVINKEANIPGLESVYIDENMTTNLVVLEDLIDIERVQINSGILLKPVIMSTGVRENHEINDSDDVPNEFIIESDSESNKHCDNYSESEFEMEDLNDLVEDGKRIVEELDQIIAEEPTNKNQLTSEEDDCCVTNVSIQEAKDIKEVEEFNAHPAPQKYNHQTEKLYTTKITGVDKKKKMSTQDFIRDSNICRGLVNAILDPFVGASLLYNSLRVSQEVKNETTTSVREIQIMCFPQSLVEESYKCCNDLNVLKRVRRYFPKAYWIHLTRHPITNILSQIECSDEIPRSMLNINVLVRGESNSDWRSQDTKSLKFHYRKSKDWLPVDIDDILLPEKHEK